MNIRRLLPLSSRGHYLPSAVPLAAAAAFAASLSFSPSSAQSSDPNPSWDIFPDTWVATDGAGRTEPTSAEAGVLKKDKKREVGIFYVTWHTASAHAGNTPYNADVTKILHRDPSARLDGKNKNWFPFSANYSYHWGEPEMGYFLSADPYVIRHDVSALADAGVDVLILDVTNSVQYWEEWEALFKVLDDMRQSGQKVPKFCFWVYNGRPIYCAQEIYDRLYRTGRYRDLWYCRDGKPLLLYNEDPGFDANGSYKREFDNYLYSQKAATDRNDPHYGDTLYTKKKIAYYPKYILDFFSLRNMWWGYYKWAGKRYVGGEGNWSFGLDLGDRNVQDLSPRERTSTWKGAIEEIAVTPAQHSSSFIGKSWRISTGEPQLDEYDMPLPTLVPATGKVMAQPSHYGIYYQDRWNEALGVDPPFIYLNDWNEWTAGKFGMNPPGEFMRRKKSDFFFVDQYNEEFNRTIGPMKDGSTDNYYMQTVENIRRYKGVRPIPVNSGYFSGWEGMTEYRDTRGDIVHRDYDGYSGLHYRDTLGRNDILLSRVGVTRKSLLFRVTAASPLTAPGKKGWMLLLIDADKDHSTGWNGYDFMVEDGKLKAFDRTAEDSTALWKDVAPLNAEVKGADYYIEIPRKLLGVRGSHIVFDFKWADNPRDLKSPIGLALGGDTAPNRRFNYRFIWDLKAGDKR